MLRQGERADGLFILLCGQADVIQTEDGESRVLATIGAGGVLGEMSLLRGKPAMANVAVRTHCFALYLPSPEFRMLIMTSPVVLEFISGLGADREEANQRPRPGAGDYSSDSIDLV
jgi:CRP-like cAMP-binding protein